VCAGGVAFPHNLFSIKSSLCWSSRTKRRWLYKQHLLLLRLLLLLLHLLPVVVVVVLSSRDRWPCEQQQPCKHAAKAAAVVTDITVCDHFYASYVRNARDPHLPSRLTVVVVVIVASLPASDRLVTSLSVITKCCCNQG
jgi:uncharacterized protein YpmS